MRLPKYTQYRIYWWCNGSLKRLELFKRYFHLNDSTNMARKGITEFYVLCKVDQKLKAFLWDGNESIQQKCANWWANYSHKILIRDHPLSAYAKFSKKLTFPTPWYAHARVLIWGLEMLIFWKILRNYLIDDPSSFAQTWL